MRSKLVKRVLLFVVIALGLIIGALYLNSAVYHLWLADGPPVKYPELHLKSFYKHISISFLSFAVAVTVSIIAWKKSRRAKKEAKRTPSDH